MDDPNSAKLMMNMALQFLSTIEDYAIQNMRMKRFISSLPEAQEPGFSLNRLLAETAQAEDTERGWRELYGEVRGLILEVPGSLPRLQAVLERLEESDPLQ